MRFHHIGCLVSNIESSARIYQALIGKVSNSPVIFHIKEQKVKVSFISLGNDSFIEFIEPLEEKSSLSKMLKKGSNFYHIAFLVPDLELKIRELQKNDYISMGVFSSEAFEGKKCVFLMNKEMHLIELIEQ